MSVSAKSRKLISGVRALGAAVGRSHQSAHEWTKHAEWPFGPGPWSAEEVPAMKAWARDTLSPDPSQMPPRRRDDTSPKSQGQKLKNTLLAIEIAEKLKQLHRDDECTARRVRQIRILNSRLFGELDTLRFPSDEHGCVTIEAARATVREWLTRLLNEFANGSDADRLTSDPSHTI
jgi:hypothetical protein